jgi:hypothetical protein
MQNVASLLRSIRRASVLAADRAGEVDGTSPLQSVIGSAPAICSVKVAESVIQTADTI